MDDRGLVVDPVPAVDLPTPLPARSNTAAWVFAAFVCAGIAIYSFTRAFVWDEGFHVLAAQLILAGKRPYIDFCYPQTPLNAYWNALWMFVLHQSWRVSHIPAVLELSGAILLLTRYMLRRFPEPAWRTACAMAAIAFFAVNSTLVQFGPIAQAYALCTFALVLSFVLATGSVASPGFLRAFFSGIAIGSGAASSLLIAPAAPVIFIWLWLKNASGSRVTKCLVFLAGCVVPFAPMFWLFAHGPRQTIFNVIEYQAIFRRADWKEGLAFSHDFDVLTAWYDSGQLLVLACCAIAAILLIRKRRQWTRFRAEYWLALWISLVLIAYISTAHPTFARYYLVGLPLVAVVAAPGVMVLARRLNPSARPFLVAVAVAAFLLFGLLRTQINDLDAVTWQRYTEISDAVAKVTPASARLFADEHVYFLLHRIPPPGMEFSYSHKVELPPKQAALLHIIPMKELKHQVETGQFATVETCDDDKIDDWNLASLYKQKKDIGDCSIFWQWGGNPPAARP